MKSLSLALAAALLLGSLSYGQSAAFKKFRGDYATLDQDLLNNECEVAAVSNFVYHKDVATFTFSEGAMYLLRYVDNRPTTAIFIGKGNALVDIPSHVERQGLMYASGDSTVNSTFEVCFMRIGDNFDLALKDKFTFTRQQMPWKDFNLAKKSQGELHFRPVIQHDYDHYFELLRSVYERRDDGFFWADFNRYEFSYDPNRPEQVLVAYEREGGDLVNTKGACLQRRERNVYEDGLMSDIVYPTTIVSREGTFDLSGLDGKTVKGHGDVRIVVNTDSLKYLSIFLHYNLGLDSMSVDGTPTEYWRRRDFNFIGVLLPKSYYKGDTLNVRMWYDGRNFLGLLPYVENPARTICKLNFTAPNDFVYLIPGMSTPTKLDGRTAFTVETAQPYNQIDIEAYTTSFQKFPMTTDIDLPLNILKSPHITKKDYDCFVPDDQYRSGVQQAFNFLGARLGNPPNIFEVSVLPEGELALPGVAEITQVHCINSNTGGFHLVAASEAARQWFGAQMRPASEREMWLADALNAYLGLMFVQEALPGAPFYSELVQRRNLMDSVIGRNMDMPLAVEASRIPDSLRVYKGAWVLHMLRNVMLDLDATSNKDARFLKFLAEAVYVTNNTTFTNADIQKIAEKHYGKPLDWFFNEWIYGRNFPEYKVTYSITPKDNQYVVNVNATVSRVGGSFQMPVITRVELEDGTSSFGRQVISGTGGSFELGPFASKPKGFFFNEFFSVLSSDKVGKGK
ncbi:hypothetical protein C3F09_09120 [candidate division GN15 bacterium]|uniref:Peptidase M1 membrane alanine aminopeptidase domain-containing protein n=1 Tax=candidate division GN15 bacterium TaxID=2072418 RepID=A0A855X286_9BACT|nr:MAG: hypothetical protein C3F09_09120 [candidate division GN15 bacterium]